MKLALFASCAPGLEPLLEREVHAIASNATRVPGGVECTGDREAVARLLLELGTASHLLVRFAQFRVRELAELEAHVSRLPLTSFFKPHVPRRVRASAMGSRLYHTGAIAERVMMAMSYRLKDKTSEPVVFDAESDKIEFVNVLVRIVEDRCTLSLDLSGPPLHRRGYRKNPYRAPLREDIAHALVRVSKWTPARPLIDPMCGSGTLVIEAARIAMNIAPGLDREFAYSLTALDDEGATLTRERDRLRALVRPAPSPLLGRDRDPLAIRASLENAERAGVIDAVRFEVGTLSGTLASITAEGEEAAPRDVAYVTNPPWGERLGDPDALAPLYRALGSLVRACPKSTLAMAAHDRKLAYQTGVAVESAFLTDLGGLKATAMVGPTKPR